MRGDNASDPVLDGEAALRERLKELNLLHHAARLLNMPGEPRDILSALLELLPSAWLHPDLASAHLSVGDIELRTPGFERTPWILRAEFVVEGGTSQPGFLEVAYRGPPAGDAEPFLAEERSLLDSCAELIKTYLERRNADHERAGLARAEAAASAARAANNAKDEFLGTVAHELRSSLHVMRGWLQIMKQSGSEPSILERGMGILERNVSLQAKLIEDLLDLARITSGNLRLDLRWLELTELVEQAVEAAKPTADSKKVSLSSDLAPVGEVCIDQQRMEQVIYNLLGNALKFTPEGGQVRVSLRKAGSHAELAVQDNGPGIDPELLPTIFERFRQAGVATSRRSGLGLGLAITQQLVHLQHGTITAESAGTGKGATFRVLLPLRGLESR